MDDKQKNKNGIPILDKPGEDMFDGFEEFDDEEVEKMIGEKYEDQDVSREI